jgi:hypothetical protein
MKMLPAVAAATLLLSSAGASASATNITISLLGFDCKVAITTLSDSDNGIDSKSLLTGASSDCDFAGGGTVGKLKNIDGKTTKVATLVGTTDVAPNQRLIALLEYPFVSGGTYWVYDTSDGKKLTFLNKGTYKVDP